MSETQRRRWLVRTLVGMLIAVGVVVGGPWVYATFFAREAPEPLTLTPSPVVTPEVPTGPVDVAGSWYVQPGSEAGYRLDETLSGTAVTVVGRTEDVGGSLTVEGTQLTAASIVVDAGSISTEESARDGFFRRALDVSTYPQATFELTQPVDLSALAESAAQVSVPVSGTLTMHGVGVPVNAAFDVQRTVDGVELAGQVPVTLSDFGLTAPDLGWVVVQPTGAVEVYLLLGRTAPTDG